MIRITPIRLIGPEGEQVGIIETPDALRIAEEHHMDLVEISPDERPPVCKIMDYGRHKYDQSKKASKNRAAARASGGDLKEVRLGRSVKIDKHDVEVRVNQARRFLMHGDRVQLTQRFRGREIMHKELGLNRLTQIAEALADISKIESPPRWNGRAASILLAPDKPRIKNILLASGEGKTAKKKSKGKKKTEDVTAEEAPASTLAEEPGTEEILETQDVAAPEGMADAPTTETPAEPAETPPADA